MSWAKNGQSITIGKGQLVMKIFDNITDIVRDDLKETIQRGSKVSIAAACFSMYAYKELKSQLERIEEFRFIFPPRPSFKSGPKNKGGNSIFQGSAGRPACMERNLKSNYAMK